MFYDFTNVLFCFIAGEAEENYWENFFADNTVRNP